MARGKERAWQRMLSGRRLDILDPSPLDVELSDIAHGLARVARWNGQTIGDYPFSVAQHSVLVLELYRALNHDADPRALLYAVLHDAPEYVMGDIISPFKAAMGGSGAAAGGDDRIALNGASLIARRADGLDRAGLRTLADSRGA